MRCCRPGGHATDVQCIAHDAITVIQPLDQRCAAPTLGLAATHHVTLRGIPWIWSGLPGRRPSAARQDSRSTTPALIVDLGIGCPVNATVHCRRPSVSRRRSRHKHGTACQPKWHHRIPCKPSKPNWNHVYFLASLPFQLPGVAYTAAYSLATFGASNASIGSGFLS